MVVAFLCDAGGVGVGREGVGGWDEGGAEGCVDSRRQRHVYAASAVAQCRPALRRWMGGWVGGRGVDVKGNDICISVENEREKGDETVGMEVLSAGVRWVGGRPRVQWRWSEGVGSRPGRR